jgi:hypothetical protein
MQAVGSTRTGKKKLMMAGLGNEGCFSLPVIDALADGNEIYVARRVGRRQHRRSRAPCPAHVPGSGASTYYRESDSPGMAVASVRVCEESLV